MGLHMYEEMDTITLNGIVKDLGFGSYFEITIDKNKSIYQLKKAILRELKHIYPNIDAIGIQIWTVQIPKNDARFERLKNDDETIENLLGGEKIRYAISNIQEHFRNLNKDDVHMVVLGIQYVITPRVQRT